MLALQGANIAGLLELTPGIRSLQIHFDPLVIADHELIAQLRGLIEQLAASEDSTVPSRIIRLPLSWEDVQTDAAVGVDVRVVDPRREGHFRRLERVIRREVNRQEKHAALVRALGRTHDGRLPVEQVVAHGTRAALRRGVAPKVLQLLIAINHSH